MLSFGANKMIQTDLYSFSYKKGSLLPWCKRCGAEHFYRKGKNKKGLQKFQCRKCGFRFVWTSDLPRRHFFSNIMSFAVEIYTSLRMCASLRGVTAILKKAFNVTISHEGIRQWILKSSKSIDDNCIPSSTWHIDETYIKIRKQGYWLWVVYCRESKHVIAWHLSQTRVLDDARMVVRIAMKQSKGIRPEKIITDGLWQYPVAIKKEVGWNWREQKIRHMITTGIGKNAFIERLNREIKRRFKWFSFFYSFKGAETFFGLWFYHQNQVKTPFLT